MGRQPWKRLRSVPAPAGHGSALVEAGRRTGPLTPAQYGKQAERDAAQAFRRAGYTVTLSHLSRGKADFVAVGADVVQVQVKSTMSAERLPAAILAAAADVEAMPAGARRVGVVYLYRRGEVCRIQLQDAGWNISGPCSDAARAALARRRSKP